MNGDGTGRLADLRAMIRRLEGGGAAGATGGLPLGVTDVDQALAAGGLPLGCLHEITGGPEPEGAGGQPLLPGGDPATAFAALLLGRLAAALAAPDLIAAPAAAQNSTAAAGTAVRVRVVWITAAADLYAPGLAGYGLGPDRLLLVRARRPADILWATEESLRCRGLAAVLAEVHDLDLTASRRLQLAAEAGGTTGLLLHRVPPRAAASVAVTRWRVTAAASVSRPGEPGVGWPSWRVELLRCRGGSPGQWHLAWVDGTLQPVGPARAAEPAAEPAVWPAAGSAPTGPAAVRPLPGAAAAPSRPAPSQPDRAAG